MSSVVGLEMPNAWRTTKPNNPAFDISADQLNLTSQREMFVPGSTVTWPSTTLHKNLTDPVDAQDAATRAFVLAQVGGKDELSELNDVTITTRAANEVLVVNSGNTFWINALLVNANIDPAAAIATSKLADAAIFAFVTDNLSVFAATTSAQLAGVISDETGTGLLVFDTSPTIITPTIASFLNANHDHTAGAGGGQLTNTALISGVFAAITGIGIQTQILDMGTNKISNLVDPTLAQDAATRAFVLAQVGGKDELSELNDVTITARAANQVLVVNAGNTFFVNDFLVNANLASGVFSNIVGVGVQTQNFDLDTFGIVTATGALGSLLKHDGSRYDDFAIGAALQVLRVNAGATDLEFATLAPSVTPPFVDTTSIVEGSVDATKEIRFEVDGLTTATVRVLTPPDADIFIAGTNFAQTWTADQTFSGANLIMGANFIQFADADITITGTPADLVFDVDLGGLFDFRVQNVLEWRMTNTVLRGSPGNNIELQGSGALGFINMQSITIPAVPAGASGNIYVKNIAGVGTLFFQNTSGDFNLLAGIPPFTDANAIIEGSVDATKLLRFEIDGFTTATTRVITPPDKDITLVGTVDTLAVFAATTSAELAGVISDESGTGLLVFNTSPVFVTPALGTPSSGVLNLTAITLSGTTAQFNTALSDNDFATLAGAEALTNKTIDGDLNTILDINETQMNVSVGVSGTVLTSNGVGIPPTYQAAAGGAPFVDTTSIVEGSADATKEMRFEVDGLTTATIRVLTVQDIDLIIAGINVAQTWTADQTFSAANLIMGDNTIQLTNTDTTIKGVAGDIESDVALGQTHRFRINNVTEMEIIGTALGGIDFADNNFRSVGQIIDQTGPGGKQHNIERPGELNNGDQIGEVRWRAEDGEVVPVTQTYVRLEAVMESDTAADEQGSLALFLMENGATEIPYIRFNDNGNNLIDILKSISLTGGLTLSAGNNIVQAASGALGFLEQGEITVPATPVANKGRWYVKDVAAVSTPFFIGDDGVEQNLTAAGAATPSFIMNNYEGEVISVVTTRFLSLAGRQTDAAAEGQTTIAFPNACTLRRLTIRISANSTTGASTMRLRVAGGDGNIVISIPAAGTGVFSDLVNTDVIASGDLVAYSFVKGASGTLEIRAAALEVIA